MKKYEKKVTEYIDEFPMNHDYKRYLGEDKGDLRHEGVHGPDLGKCLEETKHVAYWAENILKASK